jgi:hypothetical protein
MFKTKVRGLIAILAIMILVSCAGQDITTSGYKTLHTIAATYNVTKSAIPDLYKSGYINDEQKNEAIRLSVEFSKVYHLAVSALSAYERTKDAEGVEEMLTKVEIALADFLKYLQPFFDKKRAWEMN